MDQPYKNRIIEIGKPVQVYRNLQRKGRWYSIRQNGLVVAHSTSLYLLDCKFVVNQKIREKIIKTGNKEVHAYIIGRYYPIKMLWSPHKPVQISYNPFKAPYFYDVLTNKELINESCFYVHLNENYVQAYGFGYYDY